MAVESAFSERTSQAKAQVTLDGRPVLDEVWQSPGPWWITAGLRQSPNDGQAPNDEQCPGPGAA